MAVKHVTEINVTMAAKEMEDYLYGYIRVQVPLFSQKRVVLELFMGGEQRLGVSLTQSQAQQLSAAILLHCHQI